MKQVFLLHPVVGLVIPEKMLGHLEKIIGRRYCVASPTIFDMGLVEGRKCIQQSAQPTGSGGRAYVILSNSHIYTFKTIVNSKQK